MLEPVRTIRELRIDCHLLGLATIEPLGWYIHEDSGPLWEGLQRLKALRHLTASTGSITEDGHAWYQRHVTNLYRA